MTDRLYRSRDDRMIAGVAGGVAENLDADPSIIRIVWARARSFLTGGIALLVYIVMAIVVPVRPEGMPYAPADDRSGDRRIDPGRCRRARSEGGWVAPDGSTVPPGATPASHRGRRDRDDRARGGLIAGLVLIVLGGFFLVRQFLPAFDLGLLVADRRDRSRCPARRCRPAAVASFGLTCRSRTMG